jgi:hypothetical protein
MRFYTSGEAAAFERLLPRLLGESGPVHGVRWREPAGIEII